MDMEIKFQLRTLNINYILLECENAGNSIYGIGLLLKHYIGFEI